MPVNAMVDGWFVRMPWAEDNPLRFIEVAQLADGTVRITSEHQELLTVPPNIHLLVALRYAQGEACGTCGSCIICTTIRAAEGETA